MLLILLGLIVDVSHFVVSGSHLIRHFDNQIVQLPLGHIQVLVGRVEARELSIERQDLLLPVHQGHLALQKLRPRFSQLVLELLNVKVSLLNLINSFLLEMPVMLDLLKHLL